MKKYTIALIMGLAGIILIMGGCGGFKNTYPKRQFFHIRLPEPPPKECPTGPRVFLLAALPEFDTEFFIYQLKPGQFTPDFYTLFNGSPARILTEEIRKSVRFHFCDAAFDGIRETLAVRGRLLALYGDFTQKNKNQESQAVMALELSLETQTLPPKILVPPKTYWAKIPIPSSHPQDLIQGWTQGLGNIVTAFYGDTDLEIPNFRMREAKVDRLIPAARAAQVMFQL